MHLRAHHEHPDRSSLHAVRFEVFLVGGLSLEPSIRGQLQGAWRAAINLVDRPLALDSFAEIATQLSDVVCFQ
jgi:hypothetical protein